MNRVIISRIIAIALIAIAATMIYMTAENWQTIKRSCYAPIQIFIVLFYSYAILLILIYLVASTSWFERGEKRQKLMFLFIFFILFPFATYILVQGSLWGYDNVQHPHRSCPGSTVWILIFLLFINVISFIILGGLVLVERRRMARARSINLDISEGLSEALMNNSNNQVAYGLLPEEIEKISIMHFSMSLSQRIIGKQEECGICFEKFQRGAEMMTLPKCDHSFHPDCVGTWLRKSLICPLCKTNIRNNLKLKNSGKLEETSVNELV